MDNKKNKETFSSQFFKSSSTLTNIRNQLLLKILFHHLKNSHPQKTVIYLDERFELPLGAVIDNERSPFLNPSLLTFIVPLQLNVPPTLKHIDAQSLIFFLRLHISISSDKLQ
jgi:hypothetical protein